MRNEYNICLFFDFEKNISRILEQESKPKRGVNGDFAAIKDEVTRLKMWVAKTGKGITEGVEESQKMMESLQSSMTNRSRKHSVGIQDLRDEIATMKSIVTSERKEGRGIDEGKIVAEVREELMPEIEYEVDSRIESKERHQGSAVKEIHHIGSNPVSDLDDADVQMASIREALSESFQEDISKIENKVQEEITSVHDTVSKFTEEQKQQALAQAELVEVALSKLAEVQKEQISSVEEALSKLTEDQKHHALAQAEDVKKLTKIMDSMKEYETGVKDMRTEMGEFNHSILAEILDVRQSFEERQTVGGNNTELRKDMVKMKDMIQNEFRSKFDECEKISREMVNNTAHMNLLICDTLNECTSGMKRRVSDGIKYGIGILFAHEDLNSAKEELNEFMASLDVEFDDPHSFNRTEVQEAIESLRDQSKKLEKRLSDIEKISKTLQANIRNTQAKIASRIVSARSVLSMTRSSILDEVSRGKESILRLVSIICEKLPIPTLINQRILDAELIFRCPRSGYEFTFTTEHYGLFTRAAQLLSRVGDKVFSPQFGPKIARADQKPTFLTRQELEQIHSILNENQFYQNHFYDSYLCRWVFAPQASKSQESKGNEVTLEFTTRKNHEIFEVEERNARMVVKSMRLYMKQMQSHLKQKVSEGSQVISIKPQSRPSTINVEHMSFREAKGLLDRHLRSGEAVRVTFRLFEKRSGSTSRKTSLKTPKRKTFEYSRSPRSLSLSKGSSPKPSLSRSRRTSKDHEYSPLDLQGLGVPLGTPPKILRMDGKILDGKIGPLGRDLKTSPKRAKKELRNQRAASPRTQAKKDPSRKRDPTSPKKKARNKSGSLGNTAIVGRKRNTISSIKRTRTRSHQ